MDMEAESQQLQQEPKFNADMAVLTCSRLLKILHRETVSRTSLHVYKPSVALAFVGSTERRILTCVVADLQGDVRYRKALDQVLMSHGSHMSHTL